MPHKREERKREGAETEEHKFGVRKGEGKTAVHLRPGSSKLREPKGGALNKRNPARKKEKLSFSAAGITKGRVQRL